MGKKYFPLLTTTVISLSLYSCPSQASYIAFESNSFQRPTYLLSPGVSPSEEFFRKNNVLNILEDLQKERLSRQSKGNYNIDFHMYPPQPLQNSLDYLIKYLQSEDAGINFSNAFWENNKTKFYAAWTAFTYDESKGSVNFSLTWTQK